MSTEPAQDPDAMRSNQRPHAAKDRCVFGCCEDLEALRALALGLRRALGKDCWSEEGRAACTAYDAAQRDGDDRG